MAVTRRGIRVGLSVGVTLVALAAIARDWTPLLRGPAPHPPEWRWQLRADPPGGPYAPALLCAAGLVALLATSGTGWARRHPRAAARMLLGAGTILGLGLTVGLVAVEPAGSMRTLMDRAASRTVTSYLGVAASPEARDPLAFIDRHAELLPSLPKHAATHPLGPVLYYRALIALCEASPSLSRLLLGSAGLSPESRPANRPPLTPEARAAALLGALLVLLMGAATVWPLAAIAERCGLDPLSASRIGLTWCLVPGAVLMAPQFDQAIALPVTAASACLAAAATGAGPRAVRMAAFGGLLGGLALLLSYGAVVFLTLGGLAALTLASRGNDFARRAVRTTGVALAGAVVVVALPVAAGHEPVQAVRGALAIHRAVYTEPRSYALWLVFNPVDLGLFLGVPLALGYGQAVLAALSRLRLAASPSPSRVMDRFRLVTAAGLALLWLSGTVRGEVGRIWIPLMPLLVVATLAEPATTRDETATGPTASDAMLLAALCLALRSRWWVP